MTSDHVSQTQLVPTPILPPFPSSLSDYITLPAAQPQIIWIISTVSFSSNLVVPNAHTVILSLSLVCCFSKRTPIHPSGPLTNYWKWSHKLQQSLTFFYFTQHFITSTAYAMIIHRAGYSHTYMAWPLGHKLLKGRDGSFSCLYFQYLAQYLAQKGL